MHSGILAATIMACSAVATNAAEVRVTGGVVRGIDEPDGSSTWLGIPYAAPPVGALRWQAPAPVRAWHGVRDATVPPNTCIQHDEGWNGGDARAGREDCLYLSIHAPRHANSERLPVLLWIHGGSNLAGSGFGTAHSALYRHGIVVVAIEYRLGVFGFMASPQLTAESPVHASGNYGLLDQVAALHWVKRNIARFGGNPEDVTIAGQSAGAYDVEMLMLTSLARGLFSKAIAQSAPGVFGPPPRAAAASEQLGTRLAESMHVPAGAARLKALRALPASDVLKASYELKPLPGDFGSLWGQAAIDGHVFTRPLAAVLADGAQAHVPLLVGSNTQEFGVGDTADAARGFINMAFGPRAPEVLAAYGLATAEGAAVDAAADPELGSAGMQVLTDVIFRCPTIHAAAGQRQVTADVWQYEFGYGPRGTGKPPAHSAELPYEFDAPPAGAARADWPPVQDYWANFIRTGDPNGAGLPQWPRLGADASYLRIMPGGIVVANDQRGAICRLLARAD
jgi:para-nitrobenzyl esterase